MDKTYVYYITLDLLTNDVIKKCEHSMSMKFNIDTDVIMDFYFHNYSTEDPENLYVVFDSNGASFMLNKEELKDIQKRNPDVQFKEFKQEKSLINLF